MPATFDGDVVHAGERARERFYDSSGYGRPVNGELVLTPVEAAYLLFRDDLQPVRHKGADGDDELLNFRNFLNVAAVSEVDLLVYKDFRDRGFYLTPKDDGPRFVVFPRGKGPWDNTVAYRVYTSSERGDVGAPTLQSLAEARAEGVLAVVDEESELTYLSVERPSLSGSTFHDLPEGIAGDLLADRVLVTNPPSTLHDRAFFGQLLGEDYLQLSLVEAAYLAETGVLDLDDGKLTLNERGRAVEGERFGRRLRAYATLRTAGIVPKTGFKFGADFRTYANVETVDTLGHAQSLVRVLPYEYDFTPRDLALDVRLAHGVRKQMIYALTGVDEIDWLSVSRITP